MIVCPKCKRFVSNVKATFNWNDDITKVVGTCKTHGQVNPEGWEYEDFVPEGGV